MLREQQSVDGVALVLPGAAAVLHADGGSGDPAARSLHPHVAHRQTAQRHQTRRRQVTDQVGVLVSVGKLGNIYAQL